MNLPFSKSLSFYLAEIGVVLLAGFAVLADQGTSGVALGEGDAHGSLHGRVLERTTRAPVPGVSVLLHGIPPQVARSDEHGMFRFTGLSTSGPKTLEVKETGFHSRPQVAFLTSLETDAKLDVLVSRTATVSGRVRKRDGTAVSGASVSLLEYAQFGEGTPMKQHRVARTVEDGEYRIADVAPGRYLVIADLPRGPTSGVSLGGQSEMAWVAVPTFYPNTTFREGAIPIVVRSSEIRNYVDIVLAESQGMCIRGHFSSAGSVRWSIEDLWYENRPRVAQGLTTRSGEFAACGIPSGHYTLTASTDESPPRFATVPLEVIGHDVDLNDISLQSLTRLPIKVGLDRARHDPMDPSTRPIQLNLLPSGRRQLPGEPLSLFVTLGTTETEIIPSSEYRVNVIPPDGLYVKAVTVQGLNVRGTAVKDINGPLVITLGRDGATLDLTVVNDDSVPVPSLSVVVGRDRTDEAIVAPADIHLILTDQNGRATIRDLPAGSYRVLVDEAWEETNIASPALFSAYKERGERIVLRPAESRSLTIRLRHHAE